MTDENKKINAREVFNTLCSAIDNREWKYEKDEEKMLVYFGVEGEDLPMQFLLMVEEERELIRLLSPMPFEMKEEKRMEGAIATCVASFGMADGNFDYDLADGKITFRMTASFKESKIGEGLFQYMISCSCAMVDKYNDQFAAINEDRMSINDFIAQNS